MGRLGLNSTLGSVNIATVIIDTGSSLNMYFLLYCHFQGCARGRVDTANTGDWRRGQRGRRQKLPKPPLAAFANYFGRHFNEQAWKNRR